MPIKPRLPRVLDQGLILRYGTPADADALAEFNIRIHSDDPNEPELFLGHWTKDLMRGNHPTTTADDFTVVVDENAGGKIVSSLCLIGQTWTYDGIPFAVGRPELVGTDPAYRRRGLVRAQFAAIHDLSAAKGHVVQAITGIPWYYRQFGYEMTVNLGGNRVYHLDLFGKTKAADGEPYQVRPATPADIPLLKELYVTCCAASLLSRTRDEQMWHYEMIEADRKSEYARNVYIVETAVNHHPIAYFEYNAWQQHFYIREIGVQTGHSWRAVGLFLLRHFTREALRLNPERAKPLMRCQFRFGTEHPIYEALARELGPSRPPYAWYLRLPDLPGFLRHIGPVLEKRLAGSVMAGHSGTLKLNLYRAHLTLVWENGRLTNIGAYEPDRVEQGDALFPELTFLHMLFGHHDLDELNTILPDCYANNEAAVLLPILFPKRPSNVIELG